MNIYLGNFSSDQITSEILRELYQLWQEKGSSRGGLPAREDFDPTELPTRLLPYLTLFDVVRSAQGIRFHVRLAGTGIVEAIGRETTGLFIDDLPNSEPIVKRASWIAQNREPVYAEKLTIDWAHKNFKTYDILGVPLAANARDVDKILYAMDFT